MDHPTWHSHCQAPSVLDMRDGTLMVFVCGRDVTNRSHIYALRKVIDKPFDRPLLHTIHSAGYRLADLQAESPLRNAE